MIWWAERDVSDFTDAGELDIADWEHWHDGGYWETGWYDAQMRSLDKVHVGHQIHIGQSYAPKVIFADEPTIHAFDQMLRDLAVIPSQTP
jgi:hypothetical protein